jgi:NCS1 family nucleobase:cation symporter-1
MSANPEGRSFGLLENFAFWATLSAGLYIMPFGSQLVPAMSIERAILATAVAALIAGLLIAAIATAAASSGMSTLELVVAPFGRHASIPLAVLLLVRNVAFAAFALSFMAEAAAVVSDRALGEGLRPAWVITFGLFAGALVWLGPEFVVRKVLRRGGVWIVLVLAIVITGSAYMEFEVPAYLKRPAVGGWPSFWQGVDIMLIVPLLWLPVVADFARLSKDTRSAGLGSFLGAFLMTIWFGSLGIVYLPAVESGDVSGFVVGMNMSLGATVLLFILHGDEVAASGISAEAAFKALPLPRLAGTAAPLLVTAAAVVVALPGDLLRAEGTFLLLGSLFIPLFGVVIADQMARRDWTRFAAVPLLAWVSGFLVYHWISPPEAGWWLDATDWFFAEKLGLPFPLTDEVTWLGAAVPAFLIAFATHFGLAAFVAFVNPPAPIKGERSG